MSDPSVSPPDAVWMLAIAYCLTFVFEVAMGSPANIPTAKRILIATLVAVVVVVAVGGVVEVYLKRRIE